MAATRKLVRFQGKKIAVLGCGQIGEALVRGMLSSGFARSADIHASARTQARVDVLGRQLSIKATTDNRIAARSADIVLVSLKPKVVVEVLAEIAPSLGPRALVISVAAAIAIKDIEKQVGERAVVRAMPNLPVIVRQGITSISRGRHTSDEHLEIARSMFDSVGRTVVVAEQHMDAVTGLSGSGPAFVFMVIESLAEGGVRAGLPRDIALELAAQTVVGSGTMVLKTGEHPAKLKDQVTTPAGCTVDGILELEAGGLRVALIKAVSHAAERAGRLGGS